MAHMVEADAAHRFMSYLFSRKVLHFQHSNISVYEPPHEYHHEGPRHIRHDLARLGDIRAHSQIRATRAMFPLLSSQQYIRKA